MDDQGYNALQMFTFPAVPPPTQFEMLHAIARLKLRPYRQQLNAR